MSCDDFFYELYSFCSKRRVPAMIVTIQRCMSYGDFVRHVLLNDQPHHKGFIRSQPDMQISFSSQLLMSYILENLMNNTLRCHFIYKKSTLNLHLVFNFTIVVELA